VGVCCGDDVGARFEAYGVEVSKGCDTAQETLRTELAAIPRNPKLWDGVCDAYDKWQLRLVRENPHLSQD
jgi:hypothetical protein